MALALNRHGLIGVFVAFGAFAIQAQTVYRCDAAGKVTYSHEPCISHEPCMNAMADALKPLLNETPAEREKRHGRFKLAPGDRQECAKLDARLVRGEAEVQAATGKTPRAAAEEALLKVGMRFRELRC